MKRRFAQVDVFTSTPYRGNPVAVVVDGNGVDLTSMQRFAHWMNLSETTFLLPPTDREADYQVRIFTPVAPCDPGRRRHHLGRGGTVTCIEGMVDL